MVATTGAQLLPSDALHALRARLLPQTTILTPNLPEAQLLLRDAERGEFAVESIAGLEAMARAVHELGPRWVLVKGGHCPFRLDGVVAKTDEEKQIVVDVLVGADQTIQIQTPYQLSRNTHGTGCSLACTSTAIC